MNLSQWTTTPTMLPGQDCGGILGFVWGFISLNMCVSEHVFRSISIYVCLCLGASGCVSGYVWGSVFLAYVGIRESMHPAESGCLGFVQKDLWRKFLWAQTQQHLLRCCQASEAVYLTFQEMRLRTAASAES